MCETRVLGIKWSVWHTLNFEEQVKGGHEVGLPSGCEEDAVETSKVGLLEEMGSKARV